MAELKKKGLGLVLWGFSGKFGNIMVLKQRNGKTFASKIPAPRIGPPSVKQVRQQGKFREAVIYAKAVLADPVKSAIYAAMAKPGQTVYHLAISHFCKSRNQGVTDASLDLEYSLNEPRAKERRKTSIGEDFKRLQQAPRKRKLQREKLAGINTLRIAVSGQDIYCGLKRSSPANPAQLVMTIDGLAVRLLRPG